MITKRETFFMKKHFISLVKRKTQKLLNFNSNCQNNVNARNGETDVLLRIFFYFVKRYLQVGN